MIGELVKLNKAEWFTKVDNQIISISENTAKSLSINDNSTNYIMVSTSNVHSKPYINSIYVIESTFEYHGECYCRLIAYSPNRNPATNAMLPIYSNDKTPLYTKYDNLTVVELDTISKPYIKTNYGILGESIMDESVYNVYDNNFFVHVRDIDKSEVEILKDSLGNIKRGIAALKHDNYTITQNVWIDNNISKPIASKSFLYSIGNLLKLGEILPVENNELVQQVNVNILGEKKNVDLHIRSFFSLPATHEDSLLIIAKAFAHVGYNNRYGSHLITHYSMDGNDEDSSLARTIDRTSFYMVMRHYKLPEETNLMTITEKYAIVYLRTDNKRIYANGLSYTNDAEYELNILHLKYDIISAVVIDIKQWIKR